MQRILYTNADGGCSVVIPAPDTGLSIQQVIEKSVPVGTAYTVVSANEVPSDRTYRNAWEHVGGAVVHNMVKAREIHKNYMRAARTPLLAALDAQYLQADERGPAGTADKATITAQKQALRDVTATAAIDAAQTPAALKAVWPAILGANHLV
jgi:hypothetical protein